MKTTEKLKAFAICAAIALALLPATMKAQNDTFFRNSFGDNIDNRDIDIMFGLMNDPFGEAPSPYGFGPSQGDPVPLGSGLLIMLTAGAGYAIARSKRSLKKTSALLMACLMTLTFTQCGKKLQTITTNGETVSITLNVGNSGRHIIEPGPGYVPITYEAGDVMYVSNGGSYAGKLTCSVDNGTFVGDIVVNNPADDLYFYFLGGLETKDLESGTTSLTVDISDQGSKLPVLSMGRAEYIEGQTSFTCNLTNKCALVEFDLEQVTSWPVKICNMFSVAKIDFANPNITPTGEVDAITLYPLAADFSVNYKKKWAILLPGESRHSVARIVYNKINNDEFCNYYDIDDIQALENGDYIYGNDAVAINNNAAPTNKNLFVVSNNGNVVEFAPGNLQYQAVTNTWRFAEHPWDYVGNASKGTVYVNNVKCDNALVASDYSGWIDLFGWGCTGFVDSYYGSTNYHPCDNEYAGTEEINSKYGPTGIHSLTLQNKSDWGYVDISNSTETGWRTLTYKEWTNLKLYHHSTNVRTYQGQIAYEYNNVTHLINGIIILPDKIWDGGEFTHVGPSPNAWNYYQFTAQDWMENYAAHGALFLPYTYQRQGTTLKASGIYWMASTTSSWKADYLSISAVSKLSINHECIRSMGCMIRLVR